MLRQFNPAEHAPARITRVVELAPDLKYPQRLIGVGQAHRHGEDGFVILDGPRSRWYAASELPPDGSDKQVVMVHVGRGVTRVSGRAGSTPVSRRGRGTTFCRGDHRGL